MLKRLVRSFYYASEGIVYTIRNERNMKIHVTIAHIILLIGMLVKLNTYDAIFVLIAIGMVISLELVNTAIEKTVDMITMESHPLAKLAKDVAAGAVLFVTFVAVPLGVIILFPYINTFILRGITMDNSIHQPSFFILASLFNLLFTFLIKAFWSQRNIENQPHILFSILFFLVAMLSLHVIWISIFITVVIIILLFYLKREYTAIGLLQSLLVSMGGFYLLYGFFY